MAWLNLAECLFSIITRQAIRHATFTSVRRKRKPMHRAIKVWVAVAIAAAMSLMATAGTVSAAATGVQPRFVAQAHTVGLSVAQTDQLQQEVTSYIHKHGGTQAALNVVDFPGGSITFAVPGERYARDLATDPHVIDAPACAGNAFCAYEGTFFTGSERSVFSNCILAPMPWTTEGSYMNHLPDRGIANWYNTKYQLIYDTPAAPSSNREVNWAPVAWIFAC